MTRIRTPLPPPIWMTPGVTLLTTMTPTAPAFCAFFTFTVKLQLPRSMRASLPDTDAAFVSAVQASAGAAGATFAVVPPGETAGPNSAVPTA